MDIKLLSDSNKVEYFEIFNSKSTFILSGYFWGSNRVNENSIYKLTYMEQVERLIKQCKKHNVNYYFVKYPIFEKKGMYITALSLKSEFILNTLDKFPNYKIINIDTDFSLNTYPAIFDIDADCFFINWYFENECVNSLQLELPGGILGFANTYNAKIALTILNNYILKHSNLAEDKTFSGIFTRNFLNIYTRCVWLPYNYMYMYSQHIYEPGKGYTHIASDKEEFYDNRYSSKDIVIAHKDLETYELHDIRKKRIGSKSIWPPNFYRQQGQKLRCMNNLKFINYLNYGLNLIQIKHFAKDFKFREYDNRILPKIEYKCNGQLKKSYNFSFNGPLIVTIIDIDTQETSIKHFKENCDKLKLSYILFYSNTQYTNKAQLFHKILQKCKKNILFININYKFKELPNVFMAKNMDIMTINLFNTNIIDGAKKCYDPRILKMLNDDIYFFAYNKTVLQFLQIWNYFNKNLKNQHKNMEYAFNKSLSINKLRCYWISKKDINIFKNLNYNDKYEHNQLIYKKFLQKLPQCGLKPALNPEALRTHYYGSKHGQQSYNKYHKLFLEY